MKEYGYIRVSSKDQNADRQYIALREAGLLDKNLFVDYESGKDFNRTNYTRLRKKLKKGDVLFVKAIDRLGRNYEEILSEWQYIVKELKADIVILDMPLLDTRNNNDLIATLIGDIVLQLLSFVAENERTNIRQRQAEGIKAAKMKGVKFGRPSLKKPENYHDVYQKWTRRIISGREAARRLNVDHTTFAKWVKEEAIPTKEIE